MEKERFRIISILACWMILLFSGVDVRGQSGVGALTLKDAIAVAKLHSYEAKMAKFSFMSQYWNYRSFRAELLPSLNLSGKVANYDRSTREVQDTSGRIKLVDNNTLNNSLGLSLDQNIPFLGGKLSLASNLSRLDQFDYDEVNYTSIPLSLTYTQSLRGYNDLKWRKKSAPIQYENAKKYFLDRMESVTINVTSRFFNVLSAQSQLELSKRNYKDRKQLYATAKKRYDELGTVGRSEILQLELSLLNAEMEINTNQLSFDVALFNLCSYMGLQQYANVRLIAPKDVPSVNIPYELVLDKAYENSVHNGDRELKLLQSQQKLAQAKSSKGIQANFSVNVGLSQTSTDLESAFRDLKDREQVGVSLSLPIFDWGQSKGRVKMAEADLELTQTEIAQADVDFRHDIETRVVKFNNQAKQCEISKRALAIAQQRYEIMKKRFQNGGVNVTDLNTAQQEFDSAEYSYVAQLRTFWDAYYNLQRLSLYDFIEMRDLTAAFDDIVR